MGASFLRRANHYFEEQLVLQTEKGLNLERNWSTSNDSGLRRIADGIYGKWCYDCDKRKLFADNKYQAIFVHCRKSMCLVAMRASLIDRDGVVIDIVDSDLVLGPGETGSLLFQSSSKQWSRVKIIDSTIY